MHGFQKLPFAMERIIEHIERLLLKHDCVIIPDFGGFVLQSASALYIKSDHSFTPARKEIVFNPTLTHNDGLLTESYMQDYFVNFDDAQQLVRKDVAAMKDALIEQYSLKMGSIGTVFLENERLVFMPAKSSEVLFSTRSYGLPVFHFLPLSARNIVPLVTSMAVSESQTQSDTRSKNIIYNIPVTRAFLRAISAVAAAVILFFLISTPISDVNKAAYTASFIPQEIMSHKTADEFTNALSVEKEEIAEKTETAETKPAKTEPTKSPAVNPPSTNAGGKKYYVQIASFKSKASAQEYIRQLKKGSEVARTANVIVSEGRARVYAQSFSTEKDAQLYLDDISKKPEHKMAWIYTIEN